MAAKKKTTKAVKKKVARPRKTFAAKAAAARKLEEKHDAKAGRRWWQVFFYTPVKKLPRVATQYVAIPLDGFADKKKAPPAFLAGKAPALIRDAHVQSAGPSKPSAEYIENNDAFAILTAPRRLVAAKAFEAVSADDEVQYKDAGLDPATTTPQEYADLMGEWPSLSGNVKIDVVSVAVDATSLEKEANRLLGDGYGFIALLTERGKATTERIDIIAADLREQVAGEWADRARASKRPMTNNAKIKLANDLIETWEDVIP